MNLRKIRNEKGLQRKYVADKLGICGKHLNDIEIGRANLTEKLAVKLSEIYKIDVVLLKKIQKGEVTTNEH